MNIFPSFVRRYMQGVLSNPDKGYQQGAIYRSGTESGVSVSDEKAMGLSPVWSCVQLISNTVCGLPIEIFRQNGEAREPLKSRHFLTDLLQFRPNRYMKPRDFRSAMTVQACLWSNAYAQIGYSGDRPVALIPLKPGRTTPHIGDDGELTYHHAHDGGVKVFAQREILHLKGITTDGLVGLERNQFARETYGLTAAAHSFAAVQFANGGRPGGVITFSEFLTPKQREQARALYEGISEGPLNKNKIWALEGGAKYEALDYAADQMQMIQSRSLQLSEVARFFGVPGVLIGAGDATSSAWPASFEQQMLSFLTFTIKAYLDEWEDAIRFSLIPPNSDINIDHDTSALVRMDSNAAANYWSRLAQNGIATRNEARVKGFNLPRSTDEGADRLTVQTNLISLDDLEGLNSEDNSSAENEPVRPMPAEIRQ